MGRGPVHWREVSSHQNMGRQVDDTMIGADLYVAGAHDGDSAYWVVGIHLRSCLSLDADVIGATRGQSRWRWPLFR